MNKEVSFPISKLLKEKGFDVPVRNYYLQKEKGNYLHEGFEDSYWGDNRIVNWNKDVVGIKPFEGFLSAPTISKVVMWLYEKHGIWISILCDVGYDTLFTYKLYSTKIGSEHCIKNGDRYDSPTEAYEAAILYTLNNLI